jgi:hypothetical protein
MFPLLLFGSIGAKGTLILGFAASEILMYYWNSRKPPPEVHIFGRRVHHGEIGALLSMSSLLVGKVPIPGAVFGALAGIGTGLVKDDIVDIREWFRFKKNGHCKRDPS